MQRDKAPWSEYNPDSVHETALVRHAMKGIRHQHVIDGFGQKLNRISRVGTDPF
jgi:hypothetical protein